MTRVRFPWPPARGRTGLFELECRKRLEAAGVLPARVWVVVNAHPPHRGGEIPAGLPGLILTILEDTGLRVAGVRVIPRSTVRGGLLSLNLIPLAPPERVIRARFHYAGALERRAAQAREARA